MSVCRKMKGAMEWNCAGVNLKQGRRETAKENGNRQEDTRQQSRYNLADNRGGANQPGVATQRGNIGNVTVQPGQASAAIENTKVSQKDQSRRANIPISKAFAPLQSNNEEQNDDRDSSEEELRGERVNEENGVLCERKSRLCKGLTYFCQQ